MVNSDELGGFAIVAAGEGGDLRHTAQLLIVLGVTTYLMAGCFDVSMRRMVPRFLEGPSDERPSWLRDLPQPLERYPAPEGWGGDHLAALQIRVGAG